MRSRVIRLLLPLALLATVGVGAAMAASTSMRSSGGTVNAVNSAKYGMVLASSSGTTLYRYTLDKKGVSMCSGACAKFWPPLLMKGNAKPTVGAGVSAGLLGTIKRSNGVAQVSYAGFPLYFYAGDRKPGDVKGQGFEGNWYVVNTTGALVKHAIAASTATPTPATTTSSGGAAAWG
jgi:predicted lipoprotein with Yx(FWY)xxD motif